MNEMKTIAEKLYQAHELIGEVLPCLDPGSPLHDDLFTAQNYIFLVGRNLPEKLLSYVPQKKEKG